MHNKTTHLILAILKQMQTEFTVNNLSTCDLINDLLLSERLQFHFLYIPIQKDVLYSWHAKYLFSLASFKILLENTAVQTAHLLLGILLVSGQSYICNILSWMQSTGQH